VDNCDEWLLSSSVQVTLHVVVAFERSDGCSVRGVVVSVVFVAVSYELTNNNNNNNNNKVDP